MNGLFMNAEACLGFMNTPPDSPDTVNECEVNVNIMNIVNIFTLSMNVHAAKRRASFRRLD